MVVPALPRVRKRPVTALSSVRVRAFGRRFPQAFSFPPSRVIVTSASRLDCAVLKRPLLNVPSLVVPGVRPAKVRCTRPRVVSKVAPSGSCCVPVSRTKRSAAALATARPPAGRQRDPDGAALDLGVQRHAELGRRQLGRGGAGVGDGVGTGVATGVGTGEGVTVGVGWGITAESGNDATPRARVSPPATVKLPAA